MHLHHRHCDCGVFAMKDTPANFEVLQRQYDNRVESICDLCGFVDECDGENIPVNCPLNDNEEGE